MRSAGLGARACFAGWSYAPRCSFVPVSQAGVLDPQGPIASAQRLLLINSTEIMLVVVVPVILATLGFAWWYRSSNARASRSLGRSL